ncbi:MAG TPA: acyltransferase domain-containing protein [Steroidobacteraceae bacterium]|jgi:malonyl CoA-acyl carrier protein transacylase
MIPTDPSPKSLLLLLSADTQEALEQQTNDLRQRLAHSDADLQGLVDGLQTVNKDAAYRRMLVCGGREDAVAALAEKRSNRILTNHVENDVRPIVLLLPGIGDQYVGMGYGLYATRAVFKEEVDRCAAILRDYLGTDIREILYPPGDAWKSVAAAPGTDLKRMLGRRGAEPEDPDTARLNTTLFAQPALFTIEYAMARLWLSLGVAPNALLGHSMGEYVAACLAGVISLRDALRLVAIRAKLVNELPEAVMLAVMLPEPELRTFLPDNLQVSLINGPAHCVVAGPPEAASEFEKTLSTRGVIYRRVQNGHAFHTRQMEEIFEPFRTQLRTVRLREPTIPYLSNVTGDWITPQQATDPEYWLLHASRTARFSDALGRLWQLDDPIPVECGPARTLSVLATQHPDRKGTLQGVIWSIRQRYENEPDEQVLQKAIGKVWLAGGPVLRSRIRPDGAQRPAVEPTAPEELRSGAISPPSEPQRDARPAAEELPVVALSDSDEPANPREKQLVEIWQTVLIRPHVGVNDSFGALGGDSLSSIAAIMEMQRAGVPDEVARGIYQDLTIREMVRQEAQSGPAAAPGSYKLASLDTIVFVRALAIYVVVASHFGLSSLLGNTSLMVVSGMSFAKFQLRAIERSQSIRPVLQLMLKLAIPCFLFTVIHQAIHGTVQLKSWLFIDNWLDPRPFKKYESPYFIDLLLQTWLLAGLPLAIAGIRRFALKRVFGYALALLATAWLMSVVVPLIWDPQRIWLAVPYMYLWLFAIGWCAAYSSTRAEKLLTSIAFVALNVIDYYGHIGFPVGWYVVVAGLAVTWFSELPVRLPQFVVNILVGAAAASLFIYLMHYQFAALASVPFSALHRATPPLLSVAAGMLGGFLVWKGWNLISQLTLRWLRRPGGWADLRLSESDV